MLLNLFFSQKLSLSNKGLIKFGFTSESFKSMLIIWLITIVFSPIVYMHGLRGWRMNIIRDQKEIEREVGDYLERGRSRAKSLNLQI